jgi:hypothetical protein
MEFPFHGSGGVTGAEEDAGFEEGALGLTTELEKFLRNDLIGMSLVDRSIFSME